MISRHLLTPEQALNWLYAGGSKDQLFDYDTAMAMAIALPRVIPGVIEFDEDGNLIQGQHELVALSTQETADLHVITVRGNAPDGRKRKRKN